MNKHFGHKRDHLQRQKCLTTKAAVSQEALRRSLGAQPGPWPQSFQPLLNPLEYPSNLDFRDIFENILPKNAFLVAAQAEPMAGTESFMDPLVLKSSS